MCMKHIKQFPYAWSVRINQTPTPTPKNMKEKLLSIIETVLNAAHGHNATRQSEIYRLGFQAIKEIIETL